jgi:hypothetical protein
MARFEVITGPVRPCRNRRAKSADLKVALFQ